MKEKNQKQVNVWKLAGGVNFIYLIQSLASGKTRANESLMTATFRINIHIVEI